MKAQLLSPRDQSFLKIWVQARAAAQKAAEAENATLPADENARGLDCGFGWVVIDPATQPFARFLKREGYAKAHHPRGNYVWGSSLHNIGTQSVSVHYAAARAAAEVFKANGVECWADQRLD